MHLDTPGNYPHNGLAGIAFDAMGWMYFGFGENLGEKYKLTGSDGATLSGGGEGGNLYRCRPDGTKLTRWARGFWNPHASCVDAFGRLFTVDNDPDSRPPCRLLHIIPGGDYGFRFRNGRKGLHPFTSWNGEIPGTLPMVAGTGEAPSGIVAYESDGLPEKYLGNLLVTSWGDHRIDRFVLKPKGASFTSKAEPLIVGGENFRPVGLALAPNGSLYCTDWVLKDYHLHGKGRVWRISAREKPDAKRDHIVLGGEVPELSRALQSLDLRVRRLAARKLTETDAGRRELLAVLGGRDKTPRPQVEALWAASLVPTQEYDFEFPQHDPDDVRIRLNSGEVGTVLGQLFGTPQFPVRSLVHRKAVFGRPNRDLFPTDADYLEEFNLSQYHLDLLQRVPHDRFPENHTNPVAMGIHGGPFTFTGLIHSLANGNDAPGFFIAGLENADVRKAEEYQRWHGVGHTPEVALLLAARRKFPRNVEIVRRGLAVNLPVVRRLAVQWVAEERLTKLRPQVEAVLDRGGVTQDLLLATIAALEMLDGKDPAEIDKMPASEYALKVVRDEKRPPELRALALRIVDWTGGQCGRQRAKEPGRVGPDRGDTPRLYF